MKRWRAALPDARWLWVGGVLVAWLVLQFAGPLGGDNDDARYTQALVDRSLVSWISERYAVWSGRMGIDAVTLLVIPHVWLWRVLNACMLGLLLWSMTAMLRRERDAGVVLFAMVGAALLSTKVWREALWWMSGSFNYLWPAALGAFACLSFVRVEWPRWVFWLTIPAAAYASFQEQTAALMMAFQLILGARLVHRGLLRWQHVAQLVASGVALTLVVLAPGSASRFGVIILYWFPEYSLLTFPERIFSGAQLALGHAFVLRHALGLLLAALVLRVAFVRSSDTSLRSVACIPLVVLLLPAAFLHLLPTGMPGVETAEWLRRFLAVRGSYQDYWIGNVANAVDVRLYLSFAMALAATAATAFSLYWIFRLEGLWPATLAVLVWLASVASTLILGLTPTLYESGHRIFLMQDLLVLGLCVALSVRAGINSGGASNELPVPRTA